MSKIAMITEIKFIRGGKGGGKGLLLAFRKRTSSTANIVVNVQARKYGNGGGGVLFITRLQDECFIDQ